MCCFILLDQVYLYYRSLEDNIYSIAVTLAERYDIPLWQVYAAHLEFLFSDSG